ncbi:hypothetical protein H112_03145 [Trichophyton rubrum D6]|uniref:Uncharacterized protein n=3 Tax=Trichophyton TaxID=5550 RepID=A0A080WKB2_TRIRC|nr:uncharacterized protein TERG_12334 [Trichophyton rubrum CBS 118892]EZF24274.1 hypothetical protein H100_03149 [Trichophyton rubrum MR850]EZF43359.1 hypothetical protein H102_03143 [Trichophyton rubrum CBS 100081]EZF54080.1 hypothetical protein H103_03157 [Trichophyton rubrum CBS 288.86]EZF64607.1 hypothetical protein H104_03139 [Trichophyton rubrum CBS 289.86]EZF75263.1 hypothetical protein H105_03162 [Trichophyton soudanense CBS 452.61]EZF85985.1 hypothetical protein H110_03150 [Trichophy
MREYPLPVNHRINIQPRLRCIQVLHLADHSLSPIAQRWLRKAYKSVSRWDGPWQCHGNWQGNQGDGKCRILKRHGQISEGQGKTNKTKQNHRQPKKEQRW